MITVDLTDSGITVPQTPYDIYNQVDGPEVTLTSYSVALGPFGFLLLQVDDIAAPSE